MKIEQKIADMRFYGDRRSKADIEYIVIQTIGNKATTHYHIVNGTAIQVVPDDYMSDAVNGARLCSKGYLHGICTKYNSVSIGVPERMSEEDKQTCLNLIMTLKQRFKVDRGKIIRQMDITGEMNPSEWSTDVLWESDIKNKLIDV